MQVCHTTAGDNILPLTKTVIIDSIMQTKSATMKQSQASTTTSNLTKPGNKESFNNHLKLN